MERTTKVLIKVADAHDGLRLYCSHANMSGFIKLYKYKMYLNS